MAREGETAVTWPELCKAILERTNPQPLILAKEMKISELGFDSLEYLDFMVDLGVPQDRIAEMETLGDLLAWPN